MQQKRKITLAKFYLFAIMMKVNGQISDNTSETTRINKYHGVWKCYYNQLADLGQ